MNPGPGVGGSIRWGTVDDDLMEFLYSDTPFKKYQKSERVSIIDYQVWMFEGDTKVEHYLWDVIGT